jgi:hypothetical protein
LTDASALIGLESLVEVGLQGCKALLKRHRREREVRKQGLQALQAQQAQQTQQQEHGASRLQDDGHVSSAEEGRLSVSTSVALHETRGVLLTLREEHARLAAEIAVVEAREGALEEEMEVEVAAATTNGAVALAAALAAALGTSEEGGASSVSAAGRDGGSGSSGSGRSGGGGAGHHFLACPVSLNRDLLQASAMQAPTRSRQLGSPSNWLHRTVA